MPSAALGRPRPFRLSGASNADQGRRLRVLKRWIHSTGRVSGRRDGHSASSPWILGPPSVFADGRRASGAPLIEPRLVTLMIRATSYGPRDAETPTGLRVLVPPALERAEQAPPRRAAWRGGEQSPREMHRNYGNS